MRGIYAAAFSINYFRIARAINFLYFRRIGETNHNVNFERTKSERMCERQQNKKQNKKTKTKFGTEIVRIGTQLIRKSFTLKHPLFCSVLSLICLYNVINARSEVLARITNALPFYFSLVVFSSFTNFFCCSLFSPPRFWFLVSLSLTRTHHWHDWLNWGGYSIQWVIVSIMWHIVATACIMTAISKLNISQHIFISIELIQNVLYVWRIGIIKRTLFFQQKKLKCAVEHMP